MLLAGCEGDSIQQSKNPPREQNPLLASLPDAFFGRMLPFAL